MDNELPDNWIKMLKKSKKKNTVWKYIEDAKVIKWPYDSQALRSTDV